MGDVFNDGFGGGGGGEEEQKSGPPPPSNAAAVASSSGLYEPEEEPTLVAVPMDVVNWDDYKETELIEDPDFCFWCQYAQTMEHYKNNNSVEKLRKYYEENFSRVHPFEYAREMQRLYRENIQNCLKNHAGQLIQGPEWSGKSIYEHTSVHSLEPRDVYDDWCRTLVRAVQVMRDTALFLGNKDDKGKILGVNNTALTMYIKTIKEAKPFLEKIASTRKSALYSIS